jgi:hypothetical protein
VATRPRASNRRHFGCIVGGVAVVVGFAYFTHSCEAARMAMNKPGGSGNILEEMFKAVGKAMIDSVWMTVEELTERGKKAREQTAATEKEPGAVRVEPSDSLDLEAKAYKYGPTYVKDLRDGSYLSWAFPAHPRPTYYSLEPGEVKRLSWTIMRRVSPSHTATEAVVDGSVMLGWREGVGTTPLVMIEHVHPESFFPYSDALDASEFPVKRLAGMLNAAWLAQKGGPKPLIVIDRREPLRAEQQQLAATEDRRQPRRFPLKNEDGKRIPPRLEVRPGSEMIFADPDPTVRFNKEGKSVFDPRSGLEMKIVRGPGREFSRYIAIVSRNDEPVAQLELAYDRAWRPGIGQTEWIHLNRVSAPDLVVPGRFRGTVSEQELPFAELARLINGYVPFAWNGVGAGHFIIVDTRDDPVEYMY